jgi:hypothetical protein
MAMVISLIRKNAVALVLVFAAALAVLGFGMKVFKPLPPETPVVKAFNTSRLDHAYWHFATLQCIADRQSLDGYVKDVAQILDPKSSIELGVDAEVMTLSRAKRLAHDRPTTHALDPQCLRAGYFEMKEQSLIMSLLH